MHEEPEVRHAGLSDWPYYHACTYVHVYVHVAVYVHCMYPWTYVPT